MVNAKASADASEATRCQFDASTRHHFRTAAAQNIPEQWSEEKAAKRGSVTGTALIDKACDVLEIIGTSPGRIDFGELSRRTAIPRATLYRILAALNARGLIRSDPSKTFSLGFRLLDLAQNVWASSDLASVASTELRRLRDMTGETTYLAVLENRSVLALGRFDGSHSKRSSASLGALKPLHCTSQGKAILAYLPKTQIDSLLVPPLARFTARTITDPESLKAQLAIIRARGFAIDDEEILDGTRCVGTVILDGDGRPVASISVAAPSFRIHPERAEQLGQELIAAARRISMQIKEPISPKRTCDAEAVPVSRSPAFSGASALWSADSNQLVWIDRFAPAIRRDNGRSQETPLDALGMSLDCAYLCKRGLAVFAGSRLVVASDTGRICEWPLAGAFRASAARVHPSGKVWVSAVKEEQALSVIGPFGADAGHEPIFEIAGEVTSLVFDRAGETLYAAEPRQGVIYALGLQERKKRILCRFPKAAGRPTGLAMDREDRLWVATYEGWSVVRLNVDGDFDQTLSLPVPSPTSIAFGGPDLSHLYITSERTGMSRDYLQNAPFAGHLFAVETHYRGLPEPVADFPSGEP